MHVHKPSLAAIIVGVTALRIAALIATPVDLHGDEAQYWVWSRTLDWGYFSKPPLVAWTIAATTAVFGDGEWAVRLAAPLAHGCAALALSVLGARMGGRAVGFWAGIGWLLMPGVSLSSALISTDALLLPLWSAALVCAWRLAQTAALRWGFALGAAIGLGLLAKYAMAYFAIGLGLAAIAAPRLRTALAGRAGLATAATALAIVSLNFAWNARHGFATVAHIAANADWRGPALDPGAVSDFLVAQLGLAGPLLPLMVLFVAWRMLRDRTLRDEPRLFLLAFAAPPLLIILGQAVLARAHGNWAATAYPAAITLAALHFADARRRLLVGATALNAAIAAAFLAAITIPAAADALGLGGAFSRVRAWEATAALVCARAAAGTPRGPFTALMVDNRLVYNDLAYYLRKERLPPLRMWVIHGRPGNQAEQAAPMRADLGARVLIIGATPDYDPWIAADFHAVGPLEPVTVPLGGGAERRLAFRAGYGFAPVPRTPDYEARLSRRDE